MQPSTLSNFKTVPFLQKETLYPLALTSLFPDPGNHWSTFCLWCICIFQIFHINGTIPYMTFHVWLLSLAVIISGFIHVVTCICTSFFFFYGRWVFHWQMDITTFYSSFMPQQMLGLSWLFGYYECYNGHWHTRVCSVPAFACSGYILGVGWRGPVWLCLTLWGTACFPK